jgi:hypothetical protein
MDHQNAMRHEQQADYWTRVANAAHRTEVTAEVRAQQEVAAADAAETLAMPAVRPARTLRS